MLFPPCLWLWTTLFSLMVILDPQSTKCSNKLTQSFNLLCGLFLWIHRLFHIHSLETSCNDSPISKTTQLNRQQKAKEETCINGKPDGLKLLIKEQELPWCPPPNGPLENSWGCTCWRALQSASPDWLETRICTGEFPSTPAWLLAHHTQSPWEGPHTDIYNLLYFIPLLNMLWTFIKVHSIVSITKTLLGDI